MANEMTEIGIAAYPERSRVIVPKSFQVNRKFNFTLEQAKFSVCSSSGYQLKTLPYGRSNSQTGSPLGFFEKAFGDLNRYLLLRCFHSENFA